VVEVGGAAVEDEVLTLDGLETGAVVVVCGVADELEELSIDEVAA
jgi:hypothetical protein